MSDPWFIHPKPVTSDAHIAIIGGGIAGVTTAIHLIDLGYKISLIEQSDTILSNASGNPAAILDPYVSASDTIERIFYLSAYKYAQDFYNSLGKNIFIQTELVKIPTVELEQNRFKKIAETYENNIVFLDNGNLVFPESGYILPSALRKSVSDMENVLLCQNVSEIILTPDERWALIDQQGRTFLTADAVIFCNAYETDNFDQTKHINLEKVWGQISYLSPEYGASRILCSKGYITPPVNTGQGKANICGATFEKCGSHILSDEAHQENLTKSPYNFQTPNIIGGRRSIRAMSNDHLPLCGPAPDQNSYIRDYQDLHHGKRHRQFRDAQYHQNLFINVGLGSRGFLTAPLLAKYLSALISGKSMPFDENICNAIHPARFIIRSLSKK